MAALLPLAHLQKYGTNLDAATLNHLYTRAFQAKESIESGLAQLDVADAAITLALFQQDLEDAEAAMELIEKHRNGHPTPPAVTEAATEAPAAPVEEKPVYLLEHLRRKAYEAYSNISHTPERSANITVVEYSAQLVSHLAKLEAAGVSEEDQAKYRKGYEEHLVAYLSAKSRTASSMITGPANFPVERNRKRMNSERKRYEEFEEYTRKALNRAINGPRVPRTPTSELEKCQAKLAIYERNHELMLKFNKMLRTEWSSKTYKTSGEEEGAMVGRIALAAGLSQELATELISYRRHSGSFGFPGFHLTNNKAEINRLKDRITVLSGKVEILDVESKVMVEFPGGKVVENYGIDRVQIIYDERPNYELKTKLKKNAFRWSPTEGAWQRQLTKNAVDAVKAVTDTWNTYGK